MSTAACPNCSGYLSKWVLDSQEWEDFHMGLDVEFHCINCGESIPPQAFFHSNPEGG